MVDVGKVADAAVPDPSTTDAAACSASMQQVNIAAVETVDTVFQFTVTVTRSQEVQVGDHDAQTNAFAVAPR